MIKQTNYFLLLFFYNHFVFDSSSLISIFNSFKLMFDSQQLNFDLTFSFSISFLKLILTLISIKMKLFILFSTINFIYNYKERSSNFLKKLLFATRERKLSM